ncbi:MAG: helix-turn-helix transcriptional regulator [Oscillospiraceae bacterium]
MRTEILKFERIRNLRIDNNLKQIQVANYLNVKQNTYSQYEIGVLNYPVDVLIKLSLFYNTSVDYLLGLTDIKEPYSKSKQSI